MRTALITVASVLAFGSGLVAQQGYRPAADIHIGGPLPASWDYLTVDSVGKRLYVSHGAEVVVIDTTTNAIVGRIADTPGVHGIAIAPTRVFTSNGRENKVSVVDARTLATLSKIDTGGANPDAIAYDPATQTVWAFNHTGKSAAEIDAKTGALVAVIPLSGTAETGQVDAAAHRVYVNIEDEHQVDVIDTASKKVVAHWPVAPGAEPTGMALDVKTHRLFVGAGPAMVMMDATTGAVVSSVPICSGTDATWYDAATKLAFSSCRDGKITIASVRGDRMTVVQTLSTAPGSRTMALDPVTHRLYVAGARPNVTGGRGNDPASFHVFIFEQK